MRKLVAIGFASLTLMACNSAERSAKREILDRLKDPDSARFGEFTESEDGTKACFGVNAKNTYGGYTGEQQVVLIKDSKTKEWDWVTEFETFSHEECVKYLNAKR